MKLQLTSGDVCKVAGLVPNTLDRWAYAWMKGHAAGGEGHGRHRKYTLVETFALYAGARWRDEGAGWERIAGLVPFLARLPQERLEAEFEAGRTVPVLPHLFGALELPTGDTFGGMFVVPPDYPELPPAVRDLMQRVDLGRLWEATTRKVAEMVLDAQLSRQGSDYRKKAGRIRGLAKR